MSNSWMGGRASAMAEGALMEQKTTKLVVDKLIERNWQYFDSQQKVNAEINQKRLDNLMIMAEHEYELHSWSDPGYHSGVGAEAIDKAIGDAVNNGEKQVLVNTNEFRLLSDRLKRSHDTSFTKDRDEWIANRYKQLTEKAVFPVNENEAALSGGFAIPLANSIPPFLDKYLELITSGEKKPHEDYNVLTSTDSNNVRHKLKR